MVTFCLVCLLMAVGGIVRAQEAAEAGAEPAAEVKPASEPSRAPGVEEQQPSLLYAPDETGNLRPVLNLSLERLEKLLRQRRAAESDAPVEPPYVLEFKADGTHQEERVRFEAEFVIRLNRDGWVKVPLRLDRCIIEPGSVEHAGPGEYLLLPDEQGEGYVCWLRGQGEEPHRLKLHVLAPVETVGDESRLQMSTPLAASTVVNVTVKGADLVGRVPDGAVLETTINDDGPSTDFRIITGRGPVSLAWWQRIVREEVLPSLEATGAIFAQIAGNSVEETATLSVRSYDQPFDRFRVRLPEGAILKSGSGPNYAAIETATAGESEGDPSGWIYEVQLDRPVRQADVRLISERSDIPEGAPIQLAGFELLEARRQSGHLAVGVAGDWQLVWGEDLNVHRVTEAELPAELRGKPIVAAFAYVAQPSSLHARVVQRQPRRVAESSLVFLVDRERERLEGQFKFSVSGARVSTLELNWPVEEWTIEEIGPSTLVDARQLDLSKRTPLVIPLLQPSQGELELSVRASRRRVADSTQLELNGPIPVAELVRPSLLAVAAADNVRIVPRSDELEGLTRQAAVFLKNLPDLQQEPLCYRVDREGQKFVADMEVLPRQVTVEGNFSARFEGARWLIEQRLSYLVQNEPINSVSFELPRDLARHDQLIVQLDGQPVRPANMVVTDTALGQAQVRVDLAAPRIGAMTFTLSYPVLFPADQVQVSLPLAVPLEGTIKRYQAYLSAGEGTEIELSSGPWQPVSAIGGTRNNSGSLLLETREPAGLISVLTRRVATIVSEPLVVERCWLQTRLTAARRQDRAVFRVSTNRSALELQLPPGTIAESVQTWVDGQLVSSRLRENQLLVLQLAPAVGVTHHTVEVVYQGNSNAERLRRPALDPPLFRSAASPCVTYWELILPDDRLMILQPVDFTAEMQWVWNRAWWQRHTALGQMELEMWSGGRRESASAGGGNRYLFSVLGAPGSLSPILLDRSVLILVASGTVLAIGLLLLQMPILRHPALLLVLATVVSTAALLRADAAMLLAQAAGIGVVLLAIAAVLKWSLTARRQAIVVVRRSPSSIIDRGSKRTPVPPIPSVAGSNSSTKTTVPIEMASESKA